MTCGLLLTMRVLMETVLGETNTLSNTLDEVIATSVRGTCDRNIGTQLGMSLQKLGPK